MISLFSCVTDMVVTQGSGRPRSFAFEHQVRSLLASGRSCLMCVLCLCISCWSAFYSLPLCRCVGCSAKAARDQLLHSASVYLREGSFEVYSKLVPNLWWFQSQREALGNEAWLYSMIELCRSKACLQHGFDETSIDGNPTLNQWVLLQSEPGSPPRVITIQRAGLLVGSRANEICAYIEEAWELGPRAIAILREELANEADNFLPLTNGGVQLHKLRGIMHDTCATANLTAVLMKDKWDVSGQLITLRIR
jgi:hypothetical protein